jgi:putative ABC transport system permease protein
MRRARMGADPGVLGRSLTIDGREHDIVGVMPREAKILFDRDIEIFLPLGDEPALTRGLHLLNVAGRLADGVELDQAAARAEAMATALRESGVTRHGVRVSAVRDILFAGTDRIVLILTGAVALVLVVVSANLAHLFIVRGWARSREFAVRGALGAGTGRIARQLLTESVLLGLVGALGGIAVARALTGWVARAAGNEAVLELADGSDARVVVFALIAAAAVGALFGLLPALRAGRVDPAGELRGGRDAGGTLRRAQLRRVLIASEVALSAVLLVGAGLLVRTVGQLLTEDAGFVARGVLTGEITLPRERYPTPESRVAFWELLMARVRALPGVETAGLSSHFPLTGDTNGGFEIVGQEFPEDARPHSKKRFVGPGFFDAMGIRVLRGRDVLPSDRRGGPEVAVVSESLAARYFPGEDPIGKRIRFLWQTDQEQEIVGVVADVRSDDLHLREQGTIYLAADQIGIASVALAIKTQGSPEALAEPLRRAVREIDSALPISDVRPVVAIVRESVANRTTMMQLLTAFGALALLLAGVGVYAVAAQAVVARTRDIGVRLAVGGSPARVVRAVMLGEALPVAIGMAIGLAAAGPAARALSSLLYDVSPTDPATLAAVALILGLASALALIVPTLRAVRIDPAAVLRGD